LLVVVVVFPVVGGLAGSEPMQALREVAVPLKILFFLQAAFTLLLLVLGGLAVPSQAGLAGQTALTHNFPQSFA
jgi:hypothetical protein